MQTFDSAIYKTEKSVRQHLESFIVKLNEKTEYARSAGVTFNALLDRYIDEEMPACHSAGIALGVTKDLMRHSAISTTFDVYGRALSLEKREANSKLIEMLFPAPVPGLPPTTQ